MIRGIRIPQPLYGNRNQGAYEPFEGDTAPSGSRFLTDAGNQSNPKAHVRHVLYFLVS